MAVIRYDQRKNLEEAEANTISTEYVRANFLPAEDAARAREIAKEVRRSARRARDYAQVGQIKADTEKLQVEPSSASCLQ
jgi:hypothetical protein